MIAGIVLAAGSGTRIGYPKGLLRTGRGDESFLQRACAVLRESSLDTVIAIVPPELEAVAARLAAGARVLVNEDPRRGQLSSLQIALAALEPAVEAVVVLPVDVPLVRAETIRALISRWVAARPAVVRPTRGLQGTEHGHPVLFDRAVFNELAGAALSEGAKPVVHRHASAAGDVPIDADEGAFIDIDTAEEYHRAFGRLPEPVRIQ